jgi:hypothetical protein
MLVEVVVEFIQLPLVVVLEALVAVVLEVMDLM